jgi:predicted small secreted protein
MNWKTIAIGVAAGFAAGYVTKQAIEQTSRPTPEKVLAHVKNTVRKDGQIYGSWIVMKPEPFQKFDVTYSVYKGGISRYMNGKQEQLEFVADANTGTLLELIEK